MEEVLDNLTGRLDEVKRLIQDLSERLLAPRSS
jgi:hypothetical protein